MKLFINDGGMKVKPNYDAPEFRKGAHFKYLMIYGSAYDPIGFENVEIVAIDTPSPNSFVVKCGDPAITLTFDIDDVQRMNIDVLLNWKFVTEHGVDIPLYKCVQKQIVNPEFNEMCKKPGEWYKISDVSYDSGKPFIACWDGQRFKRIWVSTMNGLCENEYNLNIGTPRHVEIERIS